MTTMQQTGSVPRWTLADKLRKARQHAGLEQDELAEQLGIARQSVSNYERGQTTPNRPIVWAWADVTGVDRAWLLGHGDETRRPLSQLPRLDSNQQPAGYLPGLAPFPLTATARRAAIVELREQVPLDATAA
jgi:transcriptional regulator with XRE-family HTH domain